MFSRYKDAVWPLFWPVLVLSILLFRQREAALMADGCLWIGYHVTAFGTIRINDTTFTVTPALWKDELYTTLMGHPVYEPEHTPPTLGYATDEAQIAWLIAEVTGEGRRDTGGTPLSGCHVAVMGTPSPAQSTVHHGGQPTRAPP